MKKLVGCVVAATVLAGSGSAVASQFSTDRDLANAALKKNDYVVAVLDMSGEINNVADRPKVLKLLQHTKGFNAALISQIHSVSGRHWRKYEQSAEAAILAEQIGALTDSERDDAIKAVAAVFATGVVAKTIDTDLSGAGVLLSKVDEPAFNRQLLDNAIVDLKGRRITDYDFRALADFAHRRSGAADLTEALSAALPSLTFERGALVGSVQAFNPAFAAQRIEDTTFKIYIDAQSTDGLLIVDLKKTLEGRENLRSVYKPEDADVVVTLRQLALDVEKLDENTKTVSYQQYEVKLLAAVLLMPRNATYQFEYSEGGYQYEYAFDLKLGRRKSGDSQRVIRDSGRITWSSCKNMRIVNVFGGTQPASFIANQGMQSMCAANRERVDQAEVRAHIVEGLTDQIDNADMRK